MSKTISETARAQIQSPKVTAVETVAITRILVNGKVNKSVIPARGDKPERVRYFQEAILTAGPNARDQAFEQSFFEEKDALVEGVYMFPADAFKLNQYGSPELNRYCTLVRLGPLTTQQQSFFERVGATDMSDLG